MATLSPDPEGWKNNSKTVITYIRSENAIGKYWPVKLKHNNQDETIPKEGLALHINGGPVFINGIEVTKQVLKGVENIFQHDTWAGTIIRIDKPIYTHAELCQRSWKEHRGSKSIKQKPEPRLVNEGSGGDRFSKKYRDIQRYSQEGVVRALRGEKSIEDHGFSLVLVEGVSTKK